MQPFSFQKSNNNLKWEIFTEQSNGKMTFIARRLLYSLEVIHMLKISLPLKRVKSVF